MHVWCGCRWSSVRLTHGGPRANQYHRHPRRVVERRECRRALTQHPLRCGAKLLGIVGTDVPQHAHHEIGRQVGPLLPPPSRIRRIHLAENSFQRPEVEHLALLARRRTDMRQSEHSSFRIAPIEHRRIQQRQQVHISRWRRRTRPLIRFSLRHTLVNASLRRRFDTRGRCWFHQDLRRGGFRQCRRRRSATPGQQQSRQGGAEQHGSDPWIASGKRREFRALPAFPAADSLRRAPNPIADLLQNAMLLPHAEGPGAASRASARSLLPWLQSENA